jgi:transcriptional regulator with XRE-family HTH domain
MSQNTSSTADQKFDSFSVEIGKLIRKARVEANMNQTELAAMLNKKQTSISEIERGKIEVTASTLLKLAIGLEKPVSYFFPKWIHSRVQPEKITALQAELLSFAKRLADNDLEKIIIQVRALVLQDEIQYREFALHDDGDIDPGDV